MTVRARATKPNEAEQVKDWMSKLTAECRPALEAVRKIIKTAGPELTERIKWNAPSFYYKEDIVTFGPIRAKDQINFSISPSLNCKDQVRIIAG